LGNGDGQSSLRVYKGYKYPKYAESDRGLNQSVGNPPYERKVV